MLFAQSYWHYDTERNEAGQRSDRKIRVANKARKRTIRIIDSKDPLPLEPVRKASAISEPPRK